MTDHSHAAQRGFGRSNLGLGSMATQSADAVDITGGQIRGITDLRFVGGGERQLRFGDAATFFYGNDASFGAYDEGNNRLVWAYDRPGNRFTIAPALTLSTLPVFDSNAAAMSGDVPVGGVFRNPAGALFVRT